MDGKKGVVYLDGFRFLDIYGGDMRRVAEFLGEEANNPGNSRLRLYTGEEPNNVEELIVWAFAGRPDPPPKDRDKPGYMQWNSRLNGLCPYSLEEIEELTGSQLPNKLLRPQSNVSTYYRVITAGEHSNLYTAALTFSGRSPGPSYPDSSFWGVAIKPSQITGEVGFPIQRPAVNTELMIKGLRKWSTSSQTSRITRRSSATYKDVRAIISRPLTVKEITSLRGHRAVDMISGMPWAVIKDAVAEDREVLSGWALRFLGSSFEVSRVLIDHPERPQWVITKDWAEHVVQQAHAQWLNHLEVVLACRKRLIELKQLVNARISLTRDQLEAITILIKRGKHDLFDLAIPSEDQRIVVDSIREVIDIFEAASA